MPKPKKSKKSNKRPRVIDGIPPELLEQFPDLGKMAEGAPPMAVMLGGMLAASIKTHLELMTRQTAALESIATSMKKQVGEGTSH